MSLELPLYNCNYSHLFDTYALHIYTVTAVYGESTGMGDMFDYTSYIYLLAIVSLAMINPIGFVLMEYNKQSRDSNKKMSCDRVG